MDGEEDERLSERAGSCSKSSTASANSRRTRTDGLTGRGSPRWRSLEEAISGALYAARSLARRAVASAY